MLDAKRERPRAISVANQQGGSVVVHLTKRSRAEKLGLSLVEDESGRVLILKIYPEYVAATAGLLVRHASCDADRRVLCPDLVLSSHRPPLMTGGRCGRRCQRSSGAVAGEHDRDAHGCCGWD